MICTSIQNKDYDQITALLPHVEMAEIRLDRCPLTHEQIDALFGDSDVPLVATCRLDENPGAADLLERAIIAGAKYADLEMEAPPLVGRRIREACRNWGTVLIRSCHCWDGTPDLETLRSLVAKCRSFGGEIVKIVTMAKGVEDIKAVESLYEESAPGTLVAFCMGEAGRESRLAALALGAPFTYAATSREEATAPGQLTSEEMFKAVYGSEKPFRKVEGMALRMPASKSFAQRAIVAAALADGTSRLSGYSPCGDTDAAISAARAIGAKVMINGSSVEIEGISASSGCLLGLEELHTGESGLLTRLMVPVIAEISSGGSRITGEKTLLKRPLADAHDIMAAFGVRLYPESVNEERKADCFLPLRVVGPLIPGRADISGKGGSQLISGLLTALPLAADKSVLYVHDPRSIPYLFITQDVLGKFGIKISSEMEGGDDFIQTQDWSLCTGITFKIKGGQRFHAADFTIEADWSGAAAFLAAGAIFGSVEVEGLDTRSLQADISILDILMDAGASISQLEGDTPQTGPIHVCRAPLNAFDTDLNNCPDLFPVVAVLAAFCPGESHFKGAERLRHKETDRASAIAGMLGQMGVDITVEEDMMTVRGMSLQQRLLTGNLLKGGSFASHGDHRMVMALQLASLGASSPVQIDDTHCVSKSFPGFMDQWNKIIKP